MMSLMIAYKSSRKGSFDLAMLLRSQPNLHFRKLLELRRALKMARYILSLFLISFLSLSVNAFVEDIWLPETEAPLPTTTTARPRPPPPPTPPIDECTSICLKVASCKDILQIYRQNSCEDEFNWDCFSNRNWHCLARLSCPLDHIRSGFGTTLEMQRRCMPLYMCKYFAQMYSHMNEMHEGVMQLC